MAPLSGSSLRWLGLLGLATASALWVSVRLIARPLGTLANEMAAQQGMLRPLPLSGDASAELQSLVLAFNELVHQVTSASQARQALLAGVSHDLRTPLARLRLETEMSVGNDEAKRNMEMDIEQLDAIIDKFMDYARPGDTEMRPVHLAQLIDREAQPFRDPKEIRIDSRVAIDLCVMADETELGRVFANLFENARRYGRGTDTGIAMVSVSYARAGPWIVVTVRDSGPGVPPEKLAQLTTPFFRGDAARTAATGAGLGLAIVEKALLRMGGSLELNNAPDGGLMAHVRLKQAPSH